MTGTDRSRRCASGATNSERIYQAAAPSASRSGSARSAASDPAIGLLPKGRNKQDAGRRKGVPERHFLLAKPASFLYNSSVRKTKRGKARGRYGHKTRGDTCFLDWVLFANLPRFRLEGTEHMDKAYHQKWFHLKGMLFPGLLFAGIPAALVGLLVMWIR